MTQEGPDFTTRESETVIAEMAPAEKPKRGASKAAIVASGLGLMAVSAVILQRRRKHAPQAEESAAAYAGVGEAVENG